MFPRFRLHLSAPNELPTKYVRPPEYRGPSILWQPVLVGSGKADLSIEGQSSSAIQRQHNSYANQSKNVVVDSEALMDSDQEQGDEHVDRDQCGSETCEKPYDEHQAADELGVGRDVAEPVGKSQGDDVVSVVIERAVRHNLSVTMHGHGDAEREAHE